MTIQKLTHVEVGDIIYCLIEQARRVREHGTDSTARHYESIAREIARQFPDYLFFDKQKEVRAA